MVRKQMKIIKILFINREIVLQLNYNLMSKIDISQPTWNFKKIICIPYRELRILLMSIKVIIKGCKKIDLY